MKRYLVGGAVRDRLLGLVPHERDWVVVGSTPEQMRAAGFTQVGRDFPVFLHPETRDEHALARTERKTAPGHQGFVVHAAPEVTLEEDLIRRDLTVNAIAEEDDGTLIDPFGGQADIAARLLRHVSPAFSEDPLRILRLARFAARFAPLGFRVADETRALCQSLSEAGVLGELPPERVWQEASRAIMESPAPSVFFTTLASLDSLQPWFPWLRGAPEAAWSALDQAAQVKAELPVRVAALMTPLTGVTLDAEALPQVALDLRMPKDVSTVMLACAHCAAAISRAPALSAEALLRLLEAMSAFRAPAVFERVNAAADCVAVATEQPRNADFLAAARREAVALQAADVMTDGLQGPAIGAALFEARRRRLEAWRASAATREGN